MKDRIISYSLWRTDQAKRKGKTESYFKGLETNLRLAKVIYPEWDIHVYLGKNTITLKEAAAIAKKGVTVHWFDENHGQWYGLFARFELAGEPDVFMPRDLDSVLNWRERAAVDEWLASGCEWHAMRDNPHHSVPMVGDMWGCRRGAIDNMPQRMAEWIAKDETTRNEFGGDQMFLGKKIWPIAKQNCFQHDIMDRPFNEGWRPFPEHWSISPCKHVGQTTNATGFEMLSHGDILEYTEMQKKLSVMARAPIVEIGVLNGDKARLFCKNSNQKVYVVDPIVPDSMAPTLIGSREKITEVEKKFPQYEFIHDWSYNAVRNWTEPIGYLFIDGDHRYDAVKRDFEEWFPHIIEGGCIGLHDSAAFTGGPHHWPGPSRLACELLHDKRVEYLDQVRSLTVFRKRGL